MSTPTIYALLVGIDEYAAPQIRSLHGCVNDISSFENFLYERVAGTSYHLDVLPLTNEQATYKGIINGFRSHLSKANATDVALFYYCGHGSQEPAPEIFWHLEPDRLNETLVCYDSRTPNHYDLSDKELGKLIAEVAAKDPHIVVILDSCHSGTATRDDVTSTVSIRRAITDQRERPLDTYTTFTAAELDTFTASTGTSEQNWVALPAGKHIVLSACYDSETAKELSIDGQSRGIFSYALLKTLRQSGHSLTYRDLFKKVEMLVKNRVQNQTPQVEATASNDLDRPFLGGAINRSSYFTLAYSGDKGNWTIDGGSVHGIPLTTTPETTRLAIFPLTSTADELSKLDKALAMAEISMVLPQASVVSIKAADEGSLVNDETYKAIVISIPIQRLGVVLEGDRAGLALVEDALAQSGGGGQPSLYLQLVTEPSLAQLRVLARTNSYAITHPYSSRPLTIDVSGYDSEQALIVVRRLEHIARWSTVAELENPGSSLDGAVRLEIYGVTGAPGVRSQSDQSQQTEVFPDNANIRLEYRYNQTRQRWEPPAYKIRLVNTTSRTMFCTLAFLSEEFGIDTNSYFRGGTVRIEPKTTVESQGEVWANEGMPIPSEIPADLLKQGMTEYQDQYKLIISTEPFDATLLEQDELDIPLALRDIRTNFPTSLDKLLSNVRARKPIKAGLCDEYVDWATSEASITIVHPGMSVALPKPGDEPRELLNNGAVIVSLASHPALEGRVRLTTLPHMSRDLGTQAQPALLRDMPQDTFLYQFTTSRSNDPGLSVIELLDVVNYQAVTPEAPLLLNIITIESRDTVLRSDTALLPYAFDGEFFLPLGHSVRTADGFQVVLRHLPPPILANDSSDLEIGDRSLTGSIRILLQTVIRRRLGKPERYPLLRSATVSDDGIVSYEDNTKVIAEQVAAAQRIVLYIHGIIGDTTGMVASSRPINFPETGALKSVVDHYDLILAFDYENLQTSIETTATKLRERLAAVGLKPGHHTQFHIIAHSMGGLVSRWFIEQLGGKDVVQHLVLLGTPNGGSPWPVYQDLGTILLGLGLNMAPELGWTAQILSGLVSLIEHVDVTLDQMHPTSTFLSGMAENADPKIPYTVIAGNTSLIPRLQSPEAHKRFHRLIQRLTQAFSQETLHRLASLAFDDQPNDIAVAVSSVRNISPRSKEPIRFIEVPCDHLTYFSTQVSLESMIPNGVI
ncbi:caspase family protein [Herpetosiphon giganteus]|uniref:caspase family protein n=1 Tax=Herpetosiphon giganteus TaxID=2029754 RepID=UPI00195E9067|nr:caspase family protein [Herpetosiphon giganteus]MBM7845940.1 pimeloyl-ACP methyl ester carboxylesterase [Herpetosiphon giganteus]